MAGLSQKKGITIPSIILIQGEKERKEKRRIIDPL